MGNSLIYVASLIALAVFGVVLAGVWNMGRSGGSSANLSQQLMRWRVGLQFVAIIVAMVALLIARR